MAVIARVSGTALVPGVSRNGRLYTAELISKAVERVRERIASPDGMPLTMRTHHEGGDDSLKLVGRLTGMRQGGDGRARFEAVLADTPEGRRIAGLVEDHDGKPILKGVSIRGAWVGEPRQVLTDDGQRATTADDLEIDGLDFTATPGVPGAQVDRVESVPIGAGESADRTFIYETVQEALVTAAVDEATAPNVNEADRPGGPFADPGYQKDGKKRYDLGSKTKAKAAWSYINQADNARLYTAAQLKRIKGRIKSALGKFGVTVAAQEGWLVDHVGAVSESVAEYFGADYATRPGSFSINIDNGVVCVNVASYSIDPHDLDVIARAAMSGACQALAAMDPDMDGDIDVPGAPNQDTDTEDDTDEAAPAAAVNETQPAPQPDGNPDTDRPDAGTSPSTEEAVVTDATAPAVETTVPSTTTPAGGVTLSDEQFTALMARFNPPAVPTVALAAESAATPAAVVETDDERVARLVEAAVAAQLAKDAPPVETEEQRINRLVEARVTAAVQETVAKNGPPTRKGLTAPVTEHRQSDPTSGAEFNSQGLPSDWPDKPLHQYTAEERGKYLSSALMTHVVGDRTTR